MFYPELSTYSYYLDDSDTSHQDTEPSAIVLNVGWLEAQHRFQTGTVPDGFSDLILALCERPYNKMRGFHTCSLCPDNPAHHRKFVINGEEKIIALPPLLKVYTYDKEIALGNGEIRVNGENGIVYASPTLIYHYIVVHSYRPPEEFIRAVIKRFQQM